MKKRSFCGVLAVLLLFSGCVTTRKTPEAQKSSLDVRGIWFSYYDWASLPRDEENFKISVKQCIQEIKSLGLNVIFLHAHSHSDSYYKKSTYFPVSKYVDYTLNFSEQFDAFDFFIQEAHKEGIQVHAWFNPYRVGNERQFAQIDSDSLLGEWKASDAQNGTRYILHHRGAYYLNPSSQEVRIAFANCVRELCRNYDVDCVHFDDYFYPELNDFDAALSFDKADWEASGMEKDLAQWRKDNVSLLVRDVYEAVHEEKPGAVFGISPMGNLARLLGNQQYLIDLKKWLSEDGYIDYILPQIYWGFEPKLSNGNAAPWAFDSCLESWVAITENSPVKLIVGLPLYRAGNDVKDGNEVSEWLRHDDIIARQIILCEETERVTGFSIFDWQDLHRENAKKEVENLQFAINYWKMR